MLSIRKSRLFKCWAEALFRLFRLKLNKILIIRSTSLFWHQLSNILRLNLLLENHPLPRENHPLPSESLFFVTFQAIFVILSKPTICKLIVAKEPNIYLFLTNRLWDSVTLFLWSSLLHNEYRTCHEKLQNDQFGKFSFIFRITT